MKIIERNGIKYRAITGGVTKEMEEDTLFVLDELLNKMRNDITAKHSEEPQRPRSYPRMINDAGREMTKKEKELYFKNSPE